MKWLRFCEETAAFFWQRKKDARARDGVAICMAINEDDSDNSDGDVVMNEKFTATHEIERHEFRCVRFESTMLYN